MNFGMLWFDNNPSSDLAQKVDRAVGYYQQKYGKTPTTCLVNPEMLSDGEPKNCSIDIKSNHIILHHHLWIGTTTDQDSQAE